MPMGRHKVDIGGAIMAGVEMFTRAQQQKQQKEWQEIQKAQWRTDLEERTRINDEIIKDKKLTRKLLKQEQESKELDREMREQIGAAKGQLFRGDVSMIGPQGEQVTQPTTGLEMINALTGLLTQKGQGQAASRLMQDIPIESMVTQPINELENIVKYASAEVPWAEVPEQYKKGFSEGWYSDIVAGDEAANVAMAYQVGQAMFTGSVDVPLPDYIKPEYEQSFKAGLYAAQQAYKPRSTGGGGGITPVTDPGGGPQPLEAIDSIKAAFVIGGEAVGREEAELQWSGLTNFYKTQEGAEGLYEWFKVNLGVTNADTMSPEELHDTFMQYTMQQAGFRATEPKAKQPSTFKGVSSTFRGGP